MARNLTAIVRWLNLAGIMLLSLLLLSGFIVYMAPHIGWRVDGLRSGSMVPQLNVGDVVVTRPVPSNTVAIGDIIIFHSVDKNKTMISHRVIGIETQPSLAFKTKGDANANADPFMVPAANLIGVLAFHAPFLGYAVLYLQTTSGLLVSLIIPGIIIIVLCLKSLRNELAGKKVSERSL
jgi:signal peptidase